MYVGIKRVNKLLTPESVKVTIADVNGPINQFLYLKLWQVINVAIHRILGGLVLTFNICMR